MQLKYYYKSKFKLLNSSYSLAPDKYLFDRLNHKYPSPLNKDNITSCNDQIGLKNYTLYAGYLAFIFPVTNFLILFACELPPLL